MTLKDLKKFLDDNNLTLNDDLELVFMDDEDHYYSVENICVEGDDLMFEGALLSE